MTLARSAALLALMTWLATSCAPSATEPAAGAFSALSYNVAGLPDGLNDDQNPEENIPKISPKLNAYDLVLVQEDFAYTAELRADLTHPYQSYPLEEHERLVNDGLNRFSVLPFDLDVTRVRWVACHGLTDGSSDCLANKGFSVAAHELAEGITLTVVNLHGEAGGGEEDVAARTDGFAQLASYLNEHHAGEALLVAGDTNLHAFEDDDAPVLQRLLDDTGLEDACQALDCGDENRIDRVFFRGSDELKLELTSWALAEEMIDEQGAPLSDHEGVRVEVSWLATPAPPR